MSHLRSLCPNGPRGGIRPGPCDDAVMLGLGPKGVKVYLANTLAPPLIHAWFLGVNQGTQETEGLAEKSNR